MLSNYEKIINKNFFIKLFIFDLGLTDDQVKKIQQNEFVNLRKFPFESYPDFFNKRLESHNYKLGGFAWKPAIIDILKKKEIENIIWLDSACNFNSKIFLFKLLIYDYGFASFQSSGIIKVDYNSTLQELDIASNQDLLSSSNLMAGVIGFSFKSKFANLSKNGKLTQKELIFPNNSTIANHRHDQSLLSILYWTMTKNLPFTRQRLE